MGGQERGHFQQEGVRKIITQQSPYSHKRADPTNEDITAIPTVSVPSIDVTIIATGMPADAPCSATAVVQG